MNHLSSCAQAKGSASGEQTSLEEHKFALGKFKIKFTYGLPLVLSLSHFSKFGTKNMGQIKNKVQGLLLKQSPGIAIKKSFIPRLRMIIRSTSLISFFPEKTSYSFELLNAEQ